jgi:hypothetical protein
MCESHLHSTSPPTPSNLLPQKVIIATPSTNLDYTLGPEPGPRGGGGGDKCNAMNHLTQICETTTCTTLHWVQTAKSNVQLCREKTSAALFFKYNSQLGPPYQVIVDTNFINFSIKNKVGTTSVQSQCPHNNLRVVNWLALYQFADSWPQIFNHTAHMLLGDVVHRSPLKMRG